MGRRGADTSHADRCVNIDHLTVAQSDAVSYRTGGEMSAPTFLKKRRKRNPPSRTVNVLGKTYPDCHYQPQFALGIMCDDEQEQAKLHAQLTRSLSREIRVLVI